MSGQPVEGRRDAKVAETRLPLYRHEALAARSQQQLGRPIVALPLSWTAITALLVMIVICGCTFASFADYSRTYHVRGELLQVIASQANQPQVLVTELLMPVDAIGELAEGQAVRVHLDAYPQQPRGRLRAHIESVAKVVRPSPDSHSAAARVAIAETRLACETPSPGVAVPLRPGMTFYADVVLETRTLAAWLLEPLRRSLGGDDAQ